MTLPSGILTYHEPIISARATDDGEASPFSIGSYSKWTTEPLPSTGKLIEGWHWDERVWSEATIENAAMVLPQNFDAAASGIPYSYYQSGIGSGEDCKFIDIESVSTSGIDFSGIEDTWIPRVNHGYYYKYNDQKYLFSDDSELLYLSNSETFSGLNLVTLDSVPKPGVPIVAKQIQWDRVNDEYIDTLSFDQKVDFTGIRDISGVRQDTWDYNKDMLISANIDSSLPEFIASPSSGLDLIFNKQYSASVTEVIGSGTGVYQKVHLSFAPVDTTKAITVTSAAPPISWTVVEQGPLAGHQVLLDRDLGILSFGNPVGTGGSFVPLGNEITASYYKTVRVEYEPQFSSDLASGAEADINPIYRRSPRGFLYLATTEESPASIELSAILPVIQTDIYGPVYIGNLSASIVALVKDDNGNPLEDQIVTFYVDGTPVVGSFGSEGNSTDSPTDYHGQAKVFYLPPKSVNEIGEYTNKSNLDFTGQIITTSGIRINGDVSEVMLFEVWQNDYLLGHSGTTSDYYASYFLNEGITGATATELWESVHRMIWDMQVPTLFTTQIGSGQRRLVAINDATAVNPHADPVTGPLGALVPLPPTSVTDNGNGTYAVSYGGNLVDPAAIEHWGYFLVAPTDVTLMASVFNKKKNTTIYSNPISLRLRIPPYLSGLAILDAINRTTLESLYPILAGLSNGTKIPLGFRLRDNITLAGAINGVTFMSNNDSVIDPDPYDPESLVSGLWYYPGYGLPWGPPP